MSLYFFFYKNILDNKITNKRKNQIFRGVSGIKYNCDKRLARDSIWNWISRLDRWFGINELRIEEFLRIIDTSLNNIFDCLANK